jgi:hypothetical protein
LQTFCICAISSASDAISFAYPGQFHSISFSPESEAIMPDKLESHRPLSTVVTVPDPDNMPVSAQGEQGGTLQWRTDTHNYPEFEIRFQGANPSNEHKIKDHILKGSDIQPVVIRLDVIGNYQYTIRHYKKDKTCTDTGPVTFSVVRCLACPP